ncbi:hypothetical protein [Draconibacterium mangrovi]|uniref:hypothetical protein n=1 Tax=Draconibacterium mangrovi TaxID=2697469 RepID=UPI0013D87BB6|nr:hypothetical protein [Draconibacterium mangrovi]
MNELIDVYNRLSWMYANDPKFKIYISSDLLFDESDPCNLPYQENYINFKSSNIEIVPLDDLNNLLKISTNILIYKYKAIIKLLLSKNFHKIEMIDPLYYSLAESNHMKFSYYNLLDKTTKQEYKEISKANFNKFKQVHHDKNESYIFVTGPSFSRYKEINLNKNSIKIVCNTIIKDTEFLDHIGGPDIITFADPAFHFSSNLYASEFRHLVLSTVQKYNCYIAVPQATVPLMLTHYPRLKNRIIGLSFNQCINIPDETNLAVKPSGSIITFIMIPLASAISSKVYIIGADGRGKKENYFWKHNEKVQLTSLMDSVYNTHPSFFRDRSYSGHYKEHCKYFEQLLRFGESKGTKYSSLTHSYIPALIKRS